MQIKACGITKNCIWKNHGCINTVHVTFEDDSEEDLFSYYPDELYFCASEIIGLTRQQALDLRTKKDIAYLQS